MSSGNDGWLRSPATRALTLAALVMSLALGTGFLIIDTSRGSDPGSVGSAAPMTDQQATNQVVDSARQIVDAAELRGVSDSYLFLSCTSLHDPPYQAAVYLNFRLPETNSIKRIREVAAASSIACSTRIRRLRRPSQR